MLSAHQVRNSLSVTRTTRGDSRLKKHILLQQKNIAASSWPSQINLSLLCCQSWTVFLIVLIDSRTDLLEAEFEAAGLKKYRVEAEEAT